MGAALSASEIKQAKDSPQTTGSCPVPEKYRNHAIYNVYNQRIDGISNGLDASGFMGRGLIDPRNQMPVEPNQQPCPGQRKILSTSRVASTIPKGGTDTTWLYPSPQMFYNGKLSLKPGLQ
jgi:cytochrome c heme-lyase